MKKYVMRALLGIFTLAAAIAIPSDVKAATTKLTGNTLTISGTVSDIREKFKQLVIQAQIKNQSQIINKEFVDSIISKISFLNFKISSTSVPLFLC